jgi:hypothetical protein
MKYEYEKSIVLRKNIHQFKILAWENVILRDSALSFSEQ